MRTTVFAGLAVLLASPFAHAGLIGNTVTISVYYPDLSTLVKSRSFTVTDPGVELSCNSGPCAAPVDYFQPSYTLDLNANSIAFTQALLPPALGTTRDPGGFNGYVFSGLNMGSPITGVQLTQSGFTGLDLSDISFTADTVTLNLQGTSTGVNANWTITLQTASGIPEPSTLALFGLGMAAIAAKTQLRR